MDFPDFKTLKKLTIACRKCGILHYKQGDIEFTLSEEVPLSNYKKSQKSNTLKPETKVPVTDKSFESDDLSEEQMLFYSVVDPTKSSEEQHEDN